MHLRGDISWYCGITRYNLFAFPLHRYGENRRFPVPAGVLVPVCGSLRSGTNPKNFNRMVGMKNKEELPQGSLHNVMAAGTTVKGDIITESDFRLDGRVEGNIVCGAKIVIGPKAEIVGNITSVNAEVMGTVKGNMEISGILVLKASGVLNGDVATHTLEIEPNARFNGTCRMLSDKDKK